MNPAMILSFIVMYGLLLVAMTVHEFSHAFTAYLLGDSTAKSRGRLSLNPLAHIDPVGTLLLPFVFFVTTGFIFGAAKPVPIDYRQLNDPKQGLILVGASGPLANLVLAAALSLLLKFIPVGGLFQFLLEQLVVINVVLGVFNLIPIPPLDGSRIVMGILPAPLMSRYVRIEPYGFLIILGLSMLRGFDRVMLPVINLVLKLLRFGG